MRVVWRLLAVTALVAVASGCSKEVTKPPVSSNTVDSLVVLPDTAVVKIGASYGFTVLAYDSLGLQIVPTPTISYVSSDPVVMTTNGQGRVFGQNLGEARLYVSAGNGRDTAYVTVVAADTGWVAQIPGGTASLNGVFFTDDGINGWAVGDNGRVLFTESGGDVWGTQTTNTTTSLQKVWFTSAMSGWGVGRNATILHTTNGGTSWTRVGNVGASGDLNDVQFITPDVGFVVGDQGLILKTSNGGASWDSAHPTTADLYSVAFAGTNDGWAVGENGVILGTRNGGTSWTLVQPAVSVQTLRGVARPSVRKAVAVGDIGNSPYTVESADSALWVVQNAGAGYNFRSVSFANETVGYAVGSNGNGVVLRTGDGGLTWDVQSPNTGSQLNDVFFINANRGWAVGDNGVIVRTASGGAGGSGPLAHRFSSRVARHR